MTNKFPLEGYEAWSCDVCTASCNYEAMCYCIKRNDSSAECGFDEDQPESAGGCFEFMVKSGSLLHKPLTREKT